MRFTPRRSSPRLPSFDYVGSYAYHVILASNRRVPRFRDGRLGDSCLASLFVSAARYEYEILAYCFMPDHLHLLILGGDRSQLVRFIQHFKQATAYRYRALWQRSFYDHVLRREEDVAAIADYIWANPVVAGLVEEARDYRFSGPRELIESEERLTTEDGQDRAEALSLRGSST